MSVNVNLSIPLHTVNAIRNGDFDKAALSQMVVDAVRELPSDSLTSSSNQALGRPLSPPALSETSSLGDTEDGYTTRATSPPTYTPLPSEYESSSSAAGIREKVTNFREVKFPVNIIHEGKAVYTVSVRNTTTVADLHVEVEQRAGIPIERQRLTLQGKQLDFEATLYASGINHHKQIHLTQLSGICFADSSLNFWAHVTGSISERRVPVHTKPSTTTSEIGMALFEHLAPHAPIGRRQLRFRGQVVYACGNEISRTMEELGVKEASFVPFEMIIFPY